MENLVNPIEKDFDSIFNDNTSLELFNANEDDVKFKTRLNNYEVLLINRLHFNNLFLKEVGLNCMYDKFILGFLSYKISLDGQSRKEFVEVNKKTHSIKDEISNANSLKNLLDTRQ